MCVIHKHIVLASLWLFLVSATGHAYAQNAVSEDDLDALLPREATLTELRKKIDADPENEQNYHDYASLATTLGKTDQVVWAYDQLLAVYPDRDRVKLDLSLAYIAVGHYDYARILLGEVLDVKPPEAVQANIKAVLEKIDEAERRHHFKGSITVGMNSDSNANAAPNSGNILILDNIVQLGQGAQPDSDVQHFYTASLGHVYDVGALTEGMPMVWQSSVMVYSTFQDELNDLNLKLYGIRTGPEFAYKPWDVRFGLTAGYNFLTLDSRSYLRSPNVEAKLDFPVYEAFTGYAVGALEYRDFMNTESVTTYTDRNGAARQGQVGLRYVLSERSLWDLSYTKRHEEAKKAYYTNDQQTIALSNTYAFDPQWFCGALNKVFVVTRGSYKASNYSRPDALISAKKRKDNESQLQFTLARQFDYDIMLALGYNYTTVSSNIENYRYDNHRYTVSLTKNF